VGGRATVPARWEPPWLRELAALTAAEFALDGILTEPRPVVPLPEPIVVDQRAARLALMKGNCLSLLGCLPPSATGALTLYDTTAFSGDVAKLATVGISPTEAPTDIGSLVGVVSELEGMHLNSEAPNVRAVGQSGVLRLQGFLWALKLSLPRGGLEYVVGDAYYAFGLSAEEESPAGA
jgi:hypothetical protein